jgi:hypothetical protein
MKEVQDRLETLDLRLQLETPVPPVQREMQALRASLARLGRLAALGRPVPPAQMVEQARQGIRELLDRPDQLDREAIQALADRLGKLVPRVGPDLTEQQAALVQLVYRGIQEILARPETPGTLDYRARLDLRDLLGTLAVMDPPEIPETPDPEEIQARLAWLEKLAPLVPQEIRDPLVRVAIPEIRGTLAGLAQRAFEETRDRPALAAILARQVSQGIEEIQATPERLGTPARQVITALQAQRDRLAQQAIQAIQARPESRDLSGQAPQDQPDQPDLQAEALGTLDRQVQQEIRESQGARVPPETQEILGRVEPTELREELAILVRRGFRAIQETPDQQAQQAMWVLTALLGLLEKRAIVDRPAREVIRAIRVEQVIRVRLATGALLDRPVTPATLAQLVRAEIPASRELAVRQEALEKRDRLGRVERQVQRATWAIRVQLAQLASKERLAPVDRLEIEATLGALDQVVRSAVRGTPAQPEPPGLRDTPEIRELREIQVRLDQQARANQVQRDRPVMLDPEVTRETPVRQEAVRPATPAQLETEETPDQPDPEETQVIPDRQEAKESQAPPETPELRETPAPLETWDQQAILDRVEARDRRAKQAGLAPPDQQEPEAPETQDPPE